MTRGSSPPSVVLEDVGQAADIGSAAHYADPAYYAKAYARRTEDVRYYLRLVEQVGGPVLEYGVGNGRIALPLARRGFTVVGVDLSRPMLADLERQLVGEPAAVRRCLRLVHGDMRKVRLRRRFRLVLATFNTFLHLYTRQDVEAFLGCVRQHLEPQGRFVFDFSVPSPHDLCQDPEREFGAPRFRHPTTGEVTRYSERFEYDPWRQLLLVHMTFRPPGSRPAWTTPLTHRQFFPQEVESLLHYNGFEDLTWTADFSPDTPIVRADSLVVSCRARPSRRSPSR